MPCESGPAHSDYDRLENRVRKYKKLADKTTRLLCELMGKLETVGNYGRNSFLYTEELDNWWTEHKIIDRKRKEKEAEEERIKREKTAANAKKAALQASALAKLTDEEREALKL